VNVYLVQHAEAKSKEQDPDRSLTDRGRQDAQRVAALAASLGVRVDQIRHSGKTRAEETARILGEALSPANGVVKISGLAPLDDVQPVANRLDDSDQSIVLVGHLPFMERLAGQLLAGNPERIVVQFHKAGMVNLARTEDGWQLVWAVTPEIAATRIEPGS
jgi:phosphohistidine phosphatase